MIHESFDSSYPYAAMGRVSVWLPNINISKKL